MFRQLWRGSAPLTVAGLLMIPALALAIAGLLIDPRIITGAPAWLKPAKFAVSIGIYSLTLAWIFGLIPECARTRAVVGWTTAVAMVVEIAIIDLQAFRGTTSHFNISTIFDAVLFTTMGAVILIQTLSTIAIAVALWRHRFADAALGWALRLGMAITIIGALTGGLMTRPTADQLEAVRAGQRITIAGAHTVNGPDGGAGLPGTGWSTEHGDLRVAHFVGLHALQVLPFVAFVLARRGIAGVMRVRLTQTAGASYFALFGILLLQALRGQSVLAPDATTLLLLGVWALSTVVASAAIVFRPRPAHRPAAV